MVINEFSSNNGVDWVELYNNYSDQNVDLSTYALIDITQSGNKKTLNCILAPNGFVVVDWSDSLNNGGDTFKLKNGESVVDCVSYRNDADQICDGRSSQDLPVLGVGEYGARTVDGTGGWVVKTSPTKDNPNDGGTKSSSAICSTPTSTPTTSLTVTATSTPTPTPSPTPKPTAKSTPVVLSEKTDAPNVSPAPEISNLRSQLAPTATGLVASNEVKKGSPILSWLLIFSGVGLIGFTAFRLFKSANKDYNNDNGENNKVDSEVS